jgi:hypothetical protein
MGNLVGHNSGVGFVTADQVRVRREGEERRGQTGKGRDGDPNGGQGGRKR